MSRACIFDLDGTLTDTLESLTYSVNETLREMHLSRITKEQCRAYVGNGARVLVQKSLMAAGDPEASRIDEGMEIYGRVFDENSTRLVEPYEGIRDLLAELKEEGIRLAVLSNKPHRQTVRVVETVFGTDVFDLIQGQKEGVPRKPDPSAALMIAEELGAGCKETVYIGDSEVDIATGKAAGMKTIGVSWGFRGREGLKEAGADLIADSAGELKNMIQTDK